MAISIQNIDPDLSAEAIGAELKLLISVRSKRIVCCTQLKLQLLLKVKLHIQKRNYSFILVKTI